MIKSFKHKGLEDFFYTGKKKGIKPEHADRLGRILDRLNAAREKTYGVRLGIFGLFW